MSGAAVSSGGGPPEVLDAAAIRRARGPRQPVDPLRPNAVWDEEEVAGPDETVPCRVVLLAGAECPFTCAMCDLWRHTLEGPTPIGALPTQIARALREPAPLGPPRWIKLYNSSNFTDPRAVPREDRAAIAGLVRGFDRVVVETHPRLADDSLGAFAAAIGGRLEVALGLETVHSRFLPWLNKQMTPADFRAACRRLGGWGIDTRAFVLLGLPGIAEEESIVAAVEAARFAAESGCRHVSLVPTRPGNGILDRLAAERRFEPVSAAAAERALAAVLGLLPPATLVTLDCWDWDRMAGQCDRCRSARRGRVERMNRMQVVTPQETPGCGCPHGS